MDLSKYPLFIPPDGPFIFGEYDLVREIGSGGMGTVFEARRCVTVQGERLPARSVPPCALKVPDAKLLKTSPELALEILSEARMALKVHHPAVVSMIDAGEVAGIPYLAMELLEGEELASRLRRGALPASQVLELGVQIAGGLQAIHDAGLVHLDLKPANLFLPSPAVCGSWTWASPRLGRRREPIPA